MCLQLLTMKTKEKYMRIWSNHIFKKIKSLCESKFVVKIRIDKNNN